MFKEEVLKMWGALSPEGKLVCWGRRDILGYSIVKQN
jgi:hypothetical protein